MARRRQRQDPEGDVADRVLGSDDSEEERLQTPTKRVRLNVVGGTGKEEEEQHTYSSVTGAQAEQGVVTPAVRGRPKEEEPLQPDVVRRNLFPSGTTNQLAAVTPARVVKGKQESPAKQKLIFGRLVNELPVQENVKKAYRLVKKLTGSLGGNANHGPIYGELTMGSMQKMVELMKKHTGFDSHSSFIDVGSGIGKPNLHVAQDPGVKFSYGIEVDPNRWLLGINCLNAVLDAAHKQPDSVPDDARLGHRCMFEQGDIRKAKTFAPFTHVYMFSIG